MPNKFLNNFTAGEWSPLLDGRNDIQKYDSATRTLENFRVMPYGGVRFRAGFEFLHSTGEKKPRLIPFYSNDVVRFLLVLTDLKLTVLDLSGNVVGQLVSPYPEADIFRVHFRQINDVVYLVHPEHEPRRFQYDGSAFSLTAIVWDYPPFLDENIDEKQTLSVSEADEKVLITSSLPVFSDLHVGSYWLLRFKSPAASVRLSLSSSSTSPRYYMEAGWDRYELTEEQYNSGLYDIGTTYEGHAVYALWQENPGSESSETGVERVSLSIKVGGDWRLLTGETWRGTLFIEEFNSASGKWDVLREYIGNSSRNIDVSGKTSKVSTLRLRFISGGDPFATSVYVGTRPTTYRLAWATLEKADVFDSSIFKVTSVPSSTVAEVEVFQEGDKFRDEKTSTWSEGAFSSFRGHPGTIALHEQRLFFGGTRSKPNTVWGSYIGDFYNFRIGSEDSDSISYVFAAAEQNRIAWMESQNKLQATTSGREFSVGSGRFEDPLTPTNVSIRTESSNGSSVIQPALFDRSILFVGRQGKTLLEMSYDLSAEGFQSVELSLLARNITERGIVQIAQARLPDAELFSVLGDGQLACLTYDRAQGVVAWGRWCLGGDGRAVSAAALRGERDDVFVAVAREVDMDPVPPVPPTPGVATFSASGTAPVSIVDAGRWQLYVMRFQFTSAEAWKMSYLLKIATHDGLPAAFGNTSAALIGRVDEAYAQTDNELDYVSLGSGLTSAEKAGDVTIPAGSHFIELGFLDADNQNNFNDGMMVASFTIANAETMTSSFLSGAPTYDFTHGDGNDAGTAPPHTVVPATTPWSDVVVNYLPSTGTPGIPGRPGEIRTIYTVEKYAVESDDKAAGAWADCFRRYDLGGVTLKAGKPHFILGSEAHIPLFKGKPVWAVIDGRPFEASVDSAGCIVLPRDCPDARQALIGLPYRGVLRTMKLDVQLQDGGSQSRKRKIRAIHPRFFSTEAGKYGQSLSDLQPIEFRSTWNSTDATPPEFTGDKVNIFSGGADYDGGVFIVQDQPLPMTLLGLSVLYDYIA
jgi:hypothetical protein